MDKFKNLLKPDNIRVFLFYLAAAFAVHADRFILGSWALVKTHDTFDSFWPYQTALAQRIVSLQMPGWLPDYLGGLPIFYMDINWLFLPMIVGGLFKDPWALTAVTMTQFLIAGFGGYLFLKHFLRLDLPISLLGGLLWALSIVNLTYWRIFDLAVIPLLLFCTDKVACGPDRKRRLWLLLGLVISAANIQFARGAPFIAFFQLFFIFFSNKTLERRKNVLIAYLMVWAFVVLLNLPVIFSLLSSTAVGSRSLVQWVPHPFTFAGYLRHSLNLINWPFSVTVTTLGFMGSLILIYGLSQFSKWDSLIKRTFYFYAAVLVYVILIDQCAWYLTLRQHLPLVDFRLSRFHLVTPFILFLMIAANMERFINLILSSHKKVLLLAASAAAVLIPFHMTRGQFPQTYIEPLVVILTASGFMGAVFFLKNRHNQKTVFILLLLLLFSGERFLNMGLIRLGEAQPPSFVHFFQSPLFDQFRPKHKYDYRIGFINWHPSVGLHNGYQVAGGYASQYLKRYAQFWESVLPGESAEFISYPYKAYLIDNAVLKDAHPPLSIKKLTFNSELLALNNVRYLFSLNAIERPENWGLSLSHEGIPPDRHLGWRRALQSIKRIPKPIPYYIYEIDNFAQRTFMTGNFILVADNAALKTYLGKANREVLKNMVVYNSQDLTPEHIASLKSLPPPVEGMPAAQRSEIRHYSDNNIVIGITTDRPMQLILIENYLQDWTATINGRPTTILPAYGVFRSVILQQGENRVVFEYKPTYLIASLWTSGLGSMFFLLAAFFWASTVRGKESDAGAASAAENVRPGRAVEDRHTS